jgi:protein gp37
VSNSTLIEWTDVTDNPIRAKQGGNWCHKISPGCAHCYAARLNLSPMYGGNGLPYTGSPPEMKLVTDMLEGWKRQRHPKKHFVSSMTDVFGEWVPLEWQFTMLNAMLAAPRQTFQVLTKRPEIARYHILAWLESRGLTELPDNIWIGCTVEDQERANERHKHLMAIPAKVHFWSVEPMVSAIDTRALWRIYGKPEWLICGGESGKEKTIRPINPLWVSALRDACIEAGVAFFFKQWGEFLPHDCTPWNPDGSHTDLTLGKSFKVVDGKTYYRVGKKKSGRLIDGREWNQFPTGKEAA